MRKKRSAMLSLSLSFLLAAGAILPSAAYTYAAQETSSENAQAAANPTPTPDPHTKAYYQAADTDKIKGWPEGPKIEAEAAVLMDAYTGAILYAKNKDEKLYPASITKIMTTLLASENLDVEDTITISETAANSIDADSSNAGLVPGETLKVKQCLMAVMLQSANEAAYAIAEKVSGSLKKFTELMNQRARQLGCTNTHFNNASGLPDENHYTTANDMAKIAQAAWNNAMFRKFATKQYYEIPPTNKTTETRYFLNHHKMMANSEYTYDGVLGGKTGYTNAAGNTLVTYAKRGNTVLIAVVLKGVSGAYSDTAALLDYGFNNFELTKVSVDKTPVPAKFLSCDRFILSGGEEVCAFPYRRGVYVSVPKGTELGSLTTKSWYLPNPIGSSRIKSKYYFNDYYVGSGMQYEEEILPDFLSLSF